MKPTIILPTKNRREFLEQAIADVLSQSYEDFHLLVVDHNSNDGTRDLVMGISDPRIQYLHHIGYQDAAWSPKNEGLRNLPDDTFGVLFRDDDDMYSSKDSLGYLVDAALNLGDRFGICTGDYVEKDNQGNHLKTVSGNITTTDELVDKCWFPVKASIFNIDLVNEVSQLPPIRSRETILWAYFILNLIEQGYGDRGVYHIGKEIVEKIRHKGAISGENRENGCRNSAEILIKNIHNALHPYTTLSARGYRS